MRRRKGHPERDRHHPPDPRAAYRCATGKRTYATKREADDTLDALRVHTRRMGRKRPRRAYPCDRCGGWHLTAQTWRQHDNTDGKGDT